MLKRIDISGNVIDVGIIHSLRAALESGGSLSRKEIDECIQKCVDGQSKGKCDFWGRFKILV